MNVPHAMPQKMTQGRTTALIPDLANRWLTLELGVLHGIRHGTSDRSGGLRKEGKGSLAYRRDAYNASVASESARQTPGNFSRSAYHHFRYRG